jgi:hypothetical protein
MGNLSNNNLANNKLENTESKNIDFMNNKSINFKINFKQQFENTNIIKNKMAFTKINFTLVLILFSFI